MDNMQPNSEDTHETRSANSPNSIDNSQNRQNGKYKKGKGRTVLLVVFIIIFVLAVIGLVIITYSYFNGQEEYDALAAYLHLDNKSVSNIASMTVDWKGLEAINPDIVGWIFFPGTIISYPSTWRKDNDAYYLEHNFNQTSVGPFAAEYGCPVLSSENSPKWTDQANFVAGHNMLNGTMFTFFESMQNSDVFNSHRTIYLLTPRGNFDLEAISCNKITESSSSTIVPNFATEQDFHDYIQEKLDTSLVKPDPAVSSIDDIHQIMGFYTCNEPDDSFRIMVYAKVKEFLPSDSDNALSSSMVDQRYQSELDSAVNERLG